MAHFVEHMKGCDKSQRFDRKNNLYKCPLSIVRKTLRSLRSHKISWYENPARLIRLWLQTQETEMITLNDIFTHNLIKKQILRLLAANLTREEQQLLRQLRSKTFLKQLSLFWLHLKIYNTPLNVISWMMTKHGYDKCWTCWRHHQSTVCNEVYLQHTWIYLLTGRNFLQKLDKNNVPTLPNIDHPEWKILINKLKQISKEAVELSTTRVCVTKAITHLKKTCPLLKPLLLTLQKEHFSWQCETILISFQRKDLAQQIHRNIDTCKTQICQLCGKRNHREQLCPITKEILHQRRHKSAINLRKCHLNGMYAQSEHFDLLTDTLIPQEVFTKYQTTFIPFFPGNKIVEKDKNIK